MNVCEIGQSTPKVDDLVKAWVQFRGVEVDGVTDLCGYRP
jgi:hypothetical protein